MLASLLLGCLLSSAVAQLPAEWKACKTSTPNYSECLRTQVMNAIKTLLHGNKDLRTIPLDPLIIPQLETAQGDSKGPVAIDLTFTNFRIHGLSHLNVTHIQNDWKRLKMTIYVNETSVKTDYQVNGKILVVPISGKGPGRFNFGGLTMNLDLHIKNVNKKGKDYFNVEKVDLVLQPKTLKIHLENLYNGNKALGDNTNIFLNENWEVIFKELVPAIGEGIAQTIRLIANQVFSKIPASSLNIH